MYSVNATTDHYSFLPFVNSFWLYFSNIFLLFCKPISRQPGDKFSDAKLNNRERVSIVEGINTLRPRQNGRHFADDIFKCIFLYEMFEFRLKVH